MQAVANRSKRGRALSPCAGCQYASHCAGQRDACTGVANTAPDACDLFELYIDHPEQAMRKPLPAGQVPHRVINWYSLEVRYGGL
jgi:hypothetical protein